MKEKLTLLLLLLALTATAQTEHVRFLGVPLDGSIQQFQEELTARECSHDPETSATLPDGVRAFKGTYAGHDALYDFMARCFQPRASNTVTIPTAIPSCPNKGW